MTNKTIIAIIPARGGSKGIPDKNIVPVGGRPLISYTIMAARDCQRLNEILLSTDSEKIAKCAADYGLNCDSLRPAEFATDTAKTIDAVIYEIKKFEEKTKKKVDIVVVLQPTTPLRSTSDIDNALDLFLQRDVDSLISVYEASSVHPSIMYYFNGNALTPVIEMGKEIRRRQEFQKAYVRNGAIYISKRSLIMNQYTIVSNNPIPYVMPRERSINIDEPYDLELAEWMMNRHG